MTYTSGSPAPMTPEAKLADKNWRRINSWWIFVPILSCGFLGWLGFMVAAIRTGKKSYWTWCAVYAGVFAVFFAMIVVSDGEGVVSDLAAIPFLASWIVPTIHAAIVNRDYLRNLAAAGNWYQTPTPHTAQQPQAPSEPPVLGISNADYYGPTDTAPTAPSWPPAPQQPPSGQSQHRAPQYPGPQPTTPNVQASGPININTATEGGVAALPGVDEALARRIVAVRDARGGYRDIDDLAAAANLQPHELVRLRDQLDFGQQPQREQRHGHGGTGRILDI